MGSLGIDDIRRAVGSRAPGESVSYAKRDLPELPSEFSLSLQGTPNWIAYPGAVAQYRASPALHAYELEDGWEVHRDQYDPRRDPVGHFFFDAPELPIATLCAGIAGLLAYFYFDGRENEKSDEERRPWLPVAIAAGIALVVCIIVYVIAALFRVAFSGG